MTARFVGAHVPRVEDRRILTGAGRFLDDIVLPAMVHAAFVRSSVPHAVCAASTSTPPVVAPAWLECSPRPTSPESWIRSTTPSRRGSRARPRIPALADGKVRHVGDPIVLIVATSRVAADDAMESVVIDYEPLPAVATIEQALDPRSLPGVGRRREQRAVVRRA